MARCRDLESNFTATLLVLVHIKSGWLRHAQGWLTLGMLSTHYYLYSKRTWLISSSETETEFNRCEHQK